ncbi:MAG TPA: hypothetical protein VJV75_08235 [Candidatus Polarisedimenticolia bacterium]|nr:hypothetical protein [Candidatus Polarisedimenticolia bacterium]
MFLSALRIRIGLVVVGVLLAVGWAAFGHSLFPSTQARILIEFGSDPDSFTGLEVEIDGRVVGQLEKIGQATRTAFPVEPGTHQVRVVGPAFDSAPATIDAPNPGMSTMVLLEYAETPGTSGRPSLTLRP